MKFKKLDHEPHTVEGRLGYLVGGCGEVLRTVGSSICWGLSSTNPKLPFSKSGTNRDWLKREMCDLETAIKRVLEVLP